MQLNRIGAGLVVVIFIVAAACLIWGWQDVLYTLVAGLLISFSLASLFFVPAMIVYLIQERKLTSAWRKSSSLWWRMFTDLL